MGLAENNEIGAFRGLWLKCIVGQSWAKLGKVDMFSKEVIKNKVGKVGAYFYIFLNIICKAKLAKFRYESFIQGKDGKVEI